MLKYVLVFLASLMLFTAPVEAGELKCSKICKQIDKACDSVCSADEPDDRRERKACKAVCGLEKSECKFDCRLDESEHKFCVRACEADCEVDCTP